MRLHRATLAGLFAASTLVTIPLSAQTKTVAERLGLPRDTKLLILHADDLAVSHSVDIASLDALDKGAVSSASIMVPTPWLTEVATYAKAHPMADLGLHLTLTSEWETYRWGSVESKDKVSSLLDADGTFPRDGKPVGTRAKPAEVERELRAQIEKAMSLGIRPTHLDTHMGTAFTTPELTAIYVKIAREYRLPFLAPRTAPGAAAQPPFTENDVLLDAIIGIGTDVKPENWKQFYLNAIANLKPGLNEIIVHLGHDNAELQAVMVGHDAYGSAWRQRDYEVMNGAEFKQALKDHQVTVVTWRELGTLVR